MAGLGKARVWIDAGDLRLDAALVRGGRIVRAARRWMTPGTLAADPGALRDLMAARFTELLADLNVERPRVTILWQGDGLIADVVRTPVTGSSATAAARFAFADASGLDPEVPMGALTISETREGDEPGAYAVVAAPEAGLLDALRGAVEDAGGVFERLVPGAALDVRTASVAALGASAEEPIVSLLMGERQSAIAVARGGRLLLARLIDLGIASLREPFTRSLLAHGAGEERVESMADERLLLTTGVPSPKARDDGEIAPGEVFKNMQPMLQRLVVELKQSLRFTLDESERAAAGGLLLGAAASAPHLAKTLGEQAELDRFEATPEEDPRRAAGVIQSALSAPSRELSIRTVAQRGRSSRKSELVSLYTGAAAAAALAVAVGFSARREATQAERAAEAAQAAWDAERGAAEAGLGVEAAEALPALESRIDAELADSADFGAALFETALAAVDGVVLEEASGSRSVTGCSLSLNGSAAGRTPEAARRALEAFLRTLESSPLVSSVRVGSTESSVQDGRDTLRFQAEAALVETRAAWREGDQ